MASYQFDDSNATKILQKNKLKNKKSNPYHTPTSTGAGVGSFYRLDSTTSVDVTEDGSESLTYSVSSSQAGESTDSSIADLGVLLQVDKETQYHLMQQQQAQRMRYGGGPGIHIGTSVGGRNLSREKSSSAVDSLGYSDDDADDSLNYGAFNTFSGQPSDSYANDGGGGVKITPSPKSIVNKKGSSNAFSPISATADLNSCSGSNSTPNTPPPRHSARKIMSHDDVWYQKWWMCGFTDALNLNPKC